MISGGLVLLLKEDLVLFEGQDLSRTLQQMSWRSLFSVLKNFSCKSKALGFSRGKNHGKFIGEKIIEICRVPNLVGGSV